MFTTINRAAEYEASFAVEREAVEMRLFCEN